MAQRSGLSIEFKRKLLGVCRTREEKNFLLNAFKENDLGSVKDFLSKDLVDIPALWRIYSAESILYRLECAHDIKEVEGIKKELEDFSEYLKTEGGVSKYSDPSILKETDQMVVALEISMQHQGAHMQLCNYLESIMRSVRKQSIQSALDKQYAMSPEQ